MHKYTRVRRGRDGVEIKGMIDLVLVKRGMLRYEMGRGLSDQYVILCKVRLIGAWIKRRDVAVGARKIRSEKLREH